jgi:hypothetical protein
MLVPARVWRRRWQRFAAPRLRLGPHACDVVLRCVSDDDEMKDTNE